MNATIHGNASDFESSDPAPNPATLSTEVLLEAVDEAKGNAVRIKKQIEEMQRRLASTLEEAAILTKLIALRSGRALEESVNATVHFLPPSPPNAATAPTSGNNALEAVIAILEDANRPVHISDLMRLLGDKNVQIPGSGTQANLISYLRRDKRIVRPSRGMYGLAAWGLTEMASKGRRRRRRRRSK